MVKPGTSAFPSLPALPAATSGNSTVSVLRSLYEDAMEEAAAPAAFDSFTSAIASAANFTNYCTLALPDVCAAHYQDDLGRTDTTVGLSMTYGNFIQVRVAGHIHVAASWV